MSDEGSTNTVVLFHFTSRKWNNSNSHTSTSLSKEFLMEKGKLGEDNEWAMRVQLTADKSLVKRVLPSETTPTAKSFTEGWRIMKKEPKSGIAFEQGMPRTK